MKRLIVPFLVIATMLIIGLVHNPCEPRPASAAPAPAPFVCGQVYFTQEYRVSNPLPNQNDLVGRGFKVKSACEDKIAWIYNIYFHDQYDLQVGSAEFGPTVTMFEESDPPEDGYMHLCFLAQEPDDTDHYHVEVAACCFINNSQHGAVDQDVWPDPE